MTINVNNNSFKFLRGSLSLIIIFTYSLIPSISFILRYKLSCIPPPAPHANSPLRATSVSPCGCSGFRKSTKKVIVFAYTSGEKAFSFITFASLFGIAKCTSISSEITTPTPVVLHSTEEGLSLISSGQIDFNVSRTAAIFASNSWMTYLYF